MADYTILLDGLEVAIRLGIHPHEQAPQRVRLHVEMACRYEAPPDDRIEAVVDYDFLRSEIHALAGSQHFALQETLCDRVAALALRDPRVFEVRVRSMKLDIYPDAQIGCEITRRR